MLFGNGFDIVSVLYAAIPILWALTVHEFAHAWMAHKCGDDTALYSGRVTLNPLAHLDPFGTLAFFLAGFGWAKPVPVNPYNFRNPKRDDNLVSLAGVSANLISAIVFAVVLRVMLVTLDGVSTSPSIDRFINTLASVLLLSVYFNLVLMFFNLIPIPPLDGSHVLANMLPWNAREWYNMNIARNGPFILLALIFLPRFFGFSILGPIIGGPVTFLAQVLTGFRF